MLSRNGYTTRRARQDHASIQSTLDGKARIERLFEMTSDLLATISRDGHFTLLNPAWEQLLGWTREELQARPMREFMHPDDVEQTLGPLFDGDGHVGELEDLTTRYRHRDGSWRWLLWSARRDGDTWYAAAKDVTDRMWLERQALHDPLTHLPNRAAADGPRAPGARATEPHRNHGVVAMLFIDLDKFKAVNDNLGHDVGDRLLLSVSERLAELMRDSDTVARLGGDEFVILAEDLDSDGEAIALAGRVLDALEKPFPLGTAEVAMLASVGISVSHHPDTDPEAMLREADVAMYRAKGAGGRRLELFDERLRSELSTHLELEGRLREALPHQRARARLPADPAARRRPGDRLRGPRALASPRRRARGQRRGAPVDVPAPGRGERADRADRQLGAPRGLCASGDLAAGRHHDARLREHLRARADRAGPRRAGARGARLLSTPRARAVPGDQRGGRAARPRPRARRR